MTTYAKHDPGTFAWAELGAGDQAAAKAFYGTVFGWITVDVPIGGGAAYSLCRLGERDVAAIAPLAPRQRAQNAPPHWTSYFAVADVDAAAAKAAAGGGIVIAPPFDVMDAGRMAVVDDPTGAGVALWQAKRHIGAAVMREPGALRWTEAFTRDVEVSAALFASVLGARRRTMPMPGGASYTVLEVDGVAVCGFAPMPASIPSHVPSFFFPYFQVERCERTLARSIELGARALVGAASAPGVGRCAVLRDPQGATFGLLEPEG